MSISMGSGAADSAVVGTAGSGVGSSEGPVAGGTRADHEGLVAACVVAGTRCLSDELFTTSGGTSGRSSDGGVVTFGAGGFGGGGSVIRVQSAIALSRHCG